MARLPTAYDREDEVPTEILKFTRGSNNSRRATVRIQEYLNGELCLQLEDRIGGGEMWLDEDDFTELVTDLTDSLVLYIARRNAQLNRHSEEPATGDPSTGQL